jgi:anti-anti-sigma factor
MVQAKLDVEIYEPADRVRILRLHGPITRAAEQPLMAAYQKASSRGVQAVILNFGGVEAMDSSGLGLLIALQARAQHQKQRLVACGLSSPLQQAFQVTYLHEALDVYAGEAEALQSV